MRRIPFSPPDISQEEIDAVVDTLRSGWITTGPKTKEFERQIASFCGTNRAVCLQSATAAMEMTLRLLGVGEGDEVITSAYTYTASASVIHHVGAKLILVDTIPDSVQMDMEQVKNAITEKTKAIIPVDLGGIPCDYDTLFSIVEEKKELFQPNTDLQKAFGRVVIMADAAHSIGAIRDGKRSGSIADFSCFSFHAVKNLTTAEGGAVTWRVDAPVDDDNIYNEFMLLSLHGQNKDALAKNKAGSWEYDIIAPYFKCNMTDITAALGLAQLHRYESLLEERKVLYARYLERLEGTVVRVEQHLGDHCRSSMHLLLARVEGFGQDERNALICHMEENGVSCNVHYKPLPLLTAYKNLGFSIEDYPNAFAYFENEITLPLHTLMTIEDVDYVCDTLLSFVEQKHA